MRLLPHRRVNQLLGTAIERRTDSWRALSLRAYVVSTRGAPFDGRISPIGLGGRGAAPRLSYVTIPLEGEYVSLRGAGGAIVGPSEALVEDCFTWEERWESGMRALVIEWDAAHGAGPSGRVRLSPADFAHARALAHRICAPLGDEDAWRVLVPFLDRLRAMGVGITATAEISLPDVPTEVVRVERSLSEMLVRLERGPAGVDLSLATGLSERHLRRLFVEHAAWLGRFRERIRHARLPSAANWLAARLPTERIATSLGYGSARALVRALDDAGYRHPG